MIDLLKVFTSKARWSEGGELPDTLKQLAHMRISLYESMVHSKILNNSLSATYNELDFLYISGDDDSHEARNFTLKVHSVDNSVPIIKSNITVDKNSPTSDDRDM